MSTDAEISSITKPTILGREIGSVPCLKRSLLDGIIGGLTIGMGYFLYTSNGYKSSRLAMGSYAVITLASWFNCRMKWAEKEKELMQFKDAMTIRKSADKNSIGTREV
ncbi:cytochrome c oxidase assembly protein COX20, mitochondrial-like [Artemia franciscana]|uniref:Cytochrome c oxidase assembly protein COX20, mitochondrial n=1 Tax=Artemia franciscana TaxID=6661 RepID=A0AA88HLA1_ARTSF|nr:hypothetical protein QYM36_014825 [Artemia franciscana]